MLLTLLRQFCRQADRIADVAGRLARWLLVACITVSAANTIVRKVFATSSNAALELQWQLFAAAFLLSAGWTLKAGAQMRVDDLRLRLSSVVRDRLDLVLLLGLAFPVCVLFVVTAVELAVTSMGLRLVTDGGLSIARFAGPEYSRNPGGLAVWPIKSLVVLGFFLLALQVLA